MNSSTGKIFLAYYVPIIIWVGIIFYMSGVPELKVVGDGLVVWEIILRKLAHLGEFSILSWLLFRVLRYGHSISVEKSLVWAFVFVLGSSISDEYHQTFVFGRQGKVIDVVLDNMGALLALQLLNIYFVKRMRKLKILLVILTLGVLVGIVSQMVLRGVAENQRQGDSLVPSQQEDSLLGTVTALENKAVEKAEQSMQAVSEQADNLKQAITSNDKPIEVAAGELPKKYKLEVPFTSQAPFANWDAIHEETCEEASLIMLKAFLSGETLTPESVEQELQKLVTYQNKKYGDYLDSDMQELVEIARDYYGMNNLKVIYDFDKEELKKQLAKGNPVILPTAGRRLGNPNFTGAGPLYHNLVAIGYDGKKIITNDPGTRKGKGYVYDEDVLYAAIHDFSGKPEDIEKGRKAMIVVE